MTWQGARQLPRHSKAELPSLLKENGAPDCFGHKSTSAFDMLAEVCVPLQTAAKPSSDPGL